MRLTSLYNMVDFLPGGECYLCHQVVSSAGGIICSGCMSGLPYIDYACTVCATPTYSGGLCAECLLSKNHYYNLTICPFIYEYPVNRLIQDFKFHHRLEISKFMATQIVEKRSRGKCILPEAVMPVPLHRKRLKQRGFNQSQVMANQISKILGVPLIKSPMIRTKDTLPQTGLDARARRINIKNAFNVSEKQLNYKHVAVIDDVITTGTTTNEVGRALKQIGIQQIELWAFAKTK